jgi:hypothetical protein
VNYIAGFFWAYKDADMPRTNTAIHRTPVTDEDWSSVIELSFDSMEIAEPLGPLALNWSPEAHPQVASLALKPNPTASFSWLSAIALGAQALTEATGSQEDDYWIIARPDLMISDSATRRLFRIIRQDARWDNRSVAVAARPSSHKVLFTEGKARNLLVDHFFIGSPEAIRELAGLKETLQRIADGTDQRQPIVNEFLLGQFLIDKDLSEYPVKLPYWIWRGSLSATIFSAVGRRGMARWREALRSLLWNLRGLISPGFHKRGI